LLKTGQTPLQHLRIVFLLAVLSLLYSAVSGQIPPGYYNTASGKTGETLQIALYNIIKGHTSLSYDNLWGAFYATDSKANDSVWDMYSDIPGGTPPYQFYFGSEQCGTGGSGGYEGDCYSREHSFPKSWFGGTISPMYTDLFHIYPADQYVNNYHSDNPYGNVTAPSWTSLNLSKSGPSSTPGYTGTVFEPIDTYKGDFARSYFYMATRYENVIATWKNYNPNGAAVLDGSSYPAYQTWYLNMLIQWHTQDPVSAKEIARNDSIYKIQHNRNPYIDHPEYVGAVWAPPTIWPEPTSYPASFSAHNIHLQWVDATGPVIPAGYLVRLGTSGFASIPTPVDGTTYPDTGTDQHVLFGVQNVWFKNLNPNTIYYFKLFGYSGSGASIDYKTDGTVPQIQQATGQ
jgi:endonuclease I